MTSSFASTRNQNPMNENVTYYAVLRDIIQFDYYGHASILIFRCNWIDYHGKARGMKIDEFAFTLSIYYNVSTINDLF